MGNDYGNGPMMPPTPCLHPTEHCCSWFLIFLRDPPHFRNHGLGARDEQMREETTAYLWSDDSPLSNMAWLSATLPDRDDPGEETDGDRGGERLPLGDVNRLWGAIIDDGNRGGDPSSSMGEKHRWGE